MVPAKTSTKLWKPGAVVGTIHSRESLRAALRLKAGEVDLLEVRVDCFSNELAALDRALPKLKMPLIVTVRDRREGGAAPLGIQQRRELYRRFLPLAKLIDIELRNARPLESLVAEARAARIGIITSFHDFRGMPRLRKMRHLVNQSSQAGADIFKIASVLTNTADLAVMLSFLIEERRIGVSAMGMGPLGKLSRLLFGGVGSVLNYGYLHKPQVSGQWPVGLLKTRLAELAADSSSSS